MGTSLDTEIQTRLRSHLAGESSLATFIDWFSAATWDADARMSAETRALADEILLSWSEYTSGHRTAPELREQLENLMASQGPRMSPHLRRTGS